MKYVFVIILLNMLKMFWIKFLDIFVENIIYLINFGKSIVDNNEENEFEFFKYVFFIGSYIDSLKVRGKILDVELRGV